MHVVFSRNVNDGYRRGLTLMHRMGELTPSRNGPVLRVARPVSTVYTNPVERVLFDGQRNANPFFHLFEALWMLNGQRDVETVAQFNSQMRGFSDDGETFHGAYGHRWRHWPTEIDQITVAINALRENPHDRRIVIAMWDPALDLATGSKDIPCNDLIKFSITKQKLDMVVFCRSNDVIWGCYGANAVHLSVLQEYMASMIGVEMGTYTQISTDFHAYLETPYHWNTFWPLRLEDENFYNPYTEGRKVTVYPLVHDTQLFNLELAQFMAVITKQDEVRLDYLEGFTNPFFLHIGAPMYRAHRTLKRGELRKALTILTAAQSMVPHDNDWLSAGEAWIERRIYRQELVNRG